MTLELEFVTGIFQWSFGPHIKVGGGNEEVTFEGTATQLGGNTMGDIEVWKRVRWYLYFRPGAEFAVEVAEPTPPKGPRDPGDSGSVSVTLPMGLLPAFLSRIGPNRDQHVDVTITPHGAQFI
jgi:hypothetical protein